MDKKYTPPQQGFIKIIGLKEYTKDELIKESRDEGKPEVANLISFVYDKSPEIWFKLSLLRSTGITINSYTPSFRGVEKWLSENIDQEMKYVSLINQNPTINFTL